MVFFVPKYDGYSFKFQWDDGFSIKCFVTNDKSSVIIEANSAGLTSLARHLLELSQNDVPTDYHFHLDEYNSLDDGSVELIIVKK